MPRAGRGLPGPSSIYDTEPPPASASDDEFRAWCAHVRERTTTLIGEVRGDDEPERKQIARQALQHPPDAEHAPAGEFA